MNSYIFHTYFSEIRQPVKGTLGYQAKELSLHLEIGSLRVSKATVEFFFLSLSLFALCFRSLLPPAPSLGFFCLSNLLQTLKAAPDPLWLSSPVEEMASCHISMESLTE